METVRIAHEGFPEGLVINKADFDPEHHAVFGASETPAEPEAPVEPAEVKAITDMTVVELRAFAKEHSITLGAEATTKDAILAVIQAADFKLNTPESEEGKA